MDIKHLPFKASMLATAIALTGCGGDSSSSSSSNTVEEPPVVDPSVPAVGVPVSGFTISAKGGSSELGDGAEGGYVSVTKYNSASSLSLKKDGSIDTAYTLPAQELDLGSNPVTLAASETVRLVSDEDEASRSIPPAGTLYMIDEDMQNEDNDLNINRLYKSDGISSVGTESTQVTGLLINEGVALILPNHNDYDDVRLYFRNDVQNDGLITTVKIPDQNHRLGLELYAAAYYGAGAIDLSGDNNEYQGQAGGSVSIYAHTIANAGDITTKGAADGAEGNGGGDAGDIELAANIFAENKGLLTANGGKSTEAVGGEGGDISIGALEVYNTGAINADSGEGRNADSYSSSYVDVYLGAARTLVNTAPISAKGSDAHGVGTFDAGRGGDIYLDLTESYREVGFEMSLVNSGDLVVDGGSTIDKETTGRAGNGGYISILAGDDYLEDGDEPYSSEASSLATFATVTGSLSANGGDTILANEGESAYAGRGGEIEIMVFDQSASTLGSALLGYDSIDVSGGTGLDGGEGGEIELVSGDYRDEWRSRYGEFVPTLSGPLSNAVDLIANGGSSNADVVEAGEDEELGAGRSAGGVYLAVNNGFAYLQPNELTLENTGSIAANGGRSFEVSSEYSATGGFVAFQAPSGVTVTADISANGGSDEHGANSGDEENHAGSVAGNVSVVSQYGVATLDGTVSLNGGHGNLVGGDAGTIAVMSKEGSVVKGTFTMNGGNALQDTGFADETIAGDAGQVSIISAAYNSVLEATITAEPGTGDEAGETSIVVVDADCESDNCNIDDLLVGRGPR